MQERIKLQTNGIYSGMDFRIASGLFKELATFASCNCGHLRAGPRVGGCRVYVTGNLSDGESHLQKQKLVPGLDSDLDKLVPADLSFKCDTAFQSRKTPGFI